MSARPQPILVPAPPQPAPSQPPVQPRSRRPWGWLLLALVLGGIGYWLYPSSGQPGSPAASAPTAVQTAPVVRGALQQTLRVGGQTAARNFFNMTAPRIMGPEGNRPMVLMELAKSGASVKKGEVIALIDGQSLKDHIDDLGDTIDAAEADVRKRVAEQSVEMENLQQTLRMAKSELDKAKLDAAAAEVRTSIDRELLALTAEEAEARYRQLQGDVASKQISQKADLRVLELTRDRHVRHRNRHRTDLDRFTIRAPMDGMVVLSPLFRNGEMTTISEGDQISPGQSFCKVVDPSSMQIEASINQAESSHLRIGQTASVSLDAFPGLTMTAVVHSIGALATGGWRENAYIRKIPVVLRITGSDPRVIPDLSAAADVAIQKADNAVQVPLRAVQTEGGQHFVYVQAGQTYEKRPVQMGIQNGLSVAVTSGVRPGEVVALDRPTA